MDRKRSWLVAVVLACSLAVELTGCAPLQRSQLPGQAAPAVISAQTDPMVSEIDRLLQGMDNDLRSTDTLSDTPALTR